MMDDVALTLDAISRLNHIINASNDNEWNNGIHNTINNINTNSNTNSNSTIDVAMIVLKNQINDSRLVDIVSNVDTSTITKSQLEFEKILYNQLLNSNSSQMFMSRLNNLLDDIPNNRSNNTILRTINMLSIIHDHSSYQWKGMYFRINAYTNNTTTNTTTTESGLVILEYIEPILKTRSQANNINELGI